MYRRVIYTIRPYQISKTRTVNHKAAGVKTQEVIHPQGTGTSGEGSHDPDMSALGEIVKLSIAWVLASP